MEKENRKNLCYKPKARSDLRDEAYFRFMCIQFHKDSTIHSYLNNRVFLSRKSADSCSTEI